jgi:glycosyltransferase involved in cell wall biosynthesis
VRGGHGQAHGLLDGGDTERFLWRSWDALLAITPEESRIIGDAIRPSQTLLTTPHAIPDVPEAWVTPDTVVYAGSDNPSNQAALRWLLADVWPRVVAARPSARLRLVGLIGEALRGTPEVARPGVEVVGFVPDAVAELAGAGVVVAPYLYGSGLKIKVIEAAATGRPIVTTTSGVEGSGLRDGEHVVVTDDGAAFANAIVGLLAASEKATTLGSAAREFVRRHYSDQACYRPVLDLITAHAERTAAPGVIPTTVEERMALVVNQLGRPRVIVWGNGSHTRALVPVLGRIGADVACIADKGASESRTSPEGLAVVPVSALDARPGDLVVLSSQTFESDMWADLEPLRARGVEVMALYRRELVTERVRAVLQAQARHQRAQASVTRPGARRLVIVEPSAGRSNGPFLRVTRALQAAGAERGVRVVTAGARRTLPDGLEPADQALLVPAFEHAHWDMLTEAPEDIWRAVARYARIMADDLDALTARLGIDHQDTLLFHTANLVDVFAASEWLGRRAPAARPDIRLLFHFVPGQEAQWLRQTAEQVRQTYHVALALLEERGGDRVQILAQTSALAAELSVAFDRPVAPMGFPVTPQRRQGGAVGHAPRVLYAGEARTDKGFGLLPDIVRALGPDLDAGRLRLVCQISQNEFAGVALREAADALSRTPGVEVVRGFLPSGEYERVFASCDLVVLPYDPAQYRARLSAVFVDATSMGMPVVVPDGTWMSGQLAEGRGAGVVFAAPQAMDIAAAIRRAVLDPTLPVLADAARARVHEAHDPLAVLDTIVGWMAVAA